MVLGLGLGLGLVNIARYLKEGGTDGFRVRVRVRVS